MEHLFELRRDISIPGSYIPAGTRKTKSEWIKLFPGAFVSMTHLWFIDLSSVESVERCKGDVVADIVNEVFQERNLGSISYKEAAVASIKEYVKRTHG